METNGSQEERSYGMAVGLFFALLIGQNLIGMIVFGAYATGILPLIECALHRFGSLTRWASAPSPRLHLSAASRSRWWGFGRMRRGMGCKNREM